MTSISIDNCIFSHWLKGPSDPEYNSIEKIRSIIAQEKIKALITLEVRLEQLRGYSNDDIAKIENNWSKVKLGHTISQNFVIGDSDGSYKKLLTDLNRKWENLSATIHDATDSKHIVTSVDMHRANYFLTLDKKLINKMKNEGKNFKKNSIVAVNPSELIGILEKFKI